MQSGGNSSVVAGSLPKRSSMSASTSASSYDQLLILGLQNIFGMTGMFVFPGLLGRSFNSPPERIAYLYGMTFVSLRHHHYFAVGGSCCDFPLFRGHMPEILRHCWRSAICKAGGLGAAFGIILCRVADLVRSDGANPAIQFHRSSGALPARADHFRNDGHAGDHPDIECGAAQLDRPSRRARDSRLVNFLSGAVAIAVLISVSLWGGGRLRRGAILVALAAGTGCYALFRPISFAAVSSAPLLVAPHFSLRVCLRDRSRLVFLLVLLPAGMGSMAMYQMVCRLGRLKITC